MQEKISRRLAEAALKPYLRLLYRQSGHVLAISEPMREILVDRGVQPAHVSVMYNWADESLAGQPVEIPPRRSGDPLKILYAGNLGTAQRLDLVLDAIRLLPKGDVELMVVGGGAAEASLRHQARQLELTNVSFSEAVDRSEVPKLIEGAHLNLVSLSDDPLFEVTIPSKLQSLMALGAPILSFAPGEVQRIVRRAECGLAAPAGDPAGLANAIRSARELPPTWFTGAGARGRQYYQSHMSRQRGIRTLQTAVDAAIASRPARRTLRAPRGSG